MEGRLSALADQLLRLDLGILPRWLDCPQELFPLSSEPDRLIPAAKRRVRLQPALLFHEFHVTAQGQLLDPQNSRDFRGPALAHVGNGRQDVRLADPQPEWSKCFVVQGRDHSIDQPHPNGDALPRQPISRFAVGWSLLHI